MRAAKVLALTVACSLATIGVSLYRANGDAPAFFNFVSPSYAEPGNGEATPDVPSAPDPARPEAAKSVPLPDFVPQPHALTSSEPVEIGRAVQQECRDRSRMPSSA
eukprot:TRINITY_DN75635_c0_g1_i1.p1 TRINITY_DN75635_c0_g1~~TRINITY_DN75635_c0_g1_i1.p1  ORF type:complete len:106 (-),score=23.77 TRINITY_DN75635_c0_g1_i1:10-327(-)